MKRLSNLALFLVVMSAVFIILGSLMFNYFRGPVSKNSEVKAFEVKAGSTYFSVVDDLKEQKLIKSDKFFKFYVKIMNPKPLEACIYYLDETMGAKGVLNEFEKGCNSNPDAKRLTIPEGRNIEEIALLASKITNNTVDELIEFWDSDEFVDKVIEKYWFVTDNVKDSEIRHPLEGYFYTSTYELLNDKVDPEYIAYKFLDQMDKVLTKYKNEIAASNYNIHEILTLASIVQYESGDVTDMPKIAGIFQNRLDINMALQSSVTVCYALGDVNHWTDCEYNSGLDSPYNTYKYAGLTPGPILNNGTDAILAVLNPDEHDYYYFIADVCGDSKTYYAKTYSEHLANVEKYLTCY